jgi:hypothetical protein
MKRRGDRARATGRDRRVHRSRLRPEGIARAYLARKRPEALADHYPVDVVGYVRRGRGLRYERRGAGGSSNASSSSSSRRPFPKSLRRVRVHTCAPTAPLAR